MSNDVDLGVAKRPASMLVSEGGRGFTGGSGGFQTTVNKLRKWIIKGSADYTDYGWH
jgi:hypothetical protein